jgi:hypothetical protein
VFDGDVCCINCCMVVMGKPERNGPLANRLVDGKIIIKWNIEEIKLVSWTALTCIRIGTNGGLLLLRL